MERVSRATLGMTALVLALGAAQPTQADNDKGHAARDAVQIASPLRPTPPEPTVAREVQTLLTALGYDLGPIDGKWGRRSTQAYRHFARDAGLSDTRTPTSDAVETMRWIAARRGVTASPVPAGIDHHAAAEVARARNKPSMHAAPDAAPVNVPEPMQSTPDSPQVQVSSAMIAAAEADAQRIVESVHQAIASGRFDTALALASELGEVAPASGRREALADRILRNRSKAKTADETVLSTIEQTLAAVTRGDHDARHRYLDEARQHLKVLAAVTPLSPRVTELNEQIDRAALIPAMVKIESGEMRIRRYAATDRRDDGSYRTIRVKGFWIGAYEVTFDEYDRFVADTNRPNPDDEGWGRGRRPVVNVSWNEASEYTKWLSEKLGERYRLPTAEEWEYAARAASKDDYPWGRRVGRNMANCDGCGSRWDDKQTAPVGSFEPNAWGLHDAIGNVCEWTCSNRTNLQACEEFRKFEGSEKGEKTTAAVLEKSYNSRICGGGSWSHKPQPLSALSNRKPAHAQAHRAGTIGIRLLRCAPESDHCR